MRLRQGDIALIPVPFTDLSSHKRRPVIVISSDPYNAGPDMIVVAMTSNPAQTSWSFIITESDLVEGHLNRPGTVRVDKIYTLAQSLAVSRFGQVSSGVLDQVRATMLDLILASNRSR